MNLMEFFGYMFIIMFLSYLIRPRDRRRLGYVRVHKTDIGPCPVIPEPRYICKNCGMLIETGHGHTREECEAYDQDPTNPDLRLRMVMKERNRPGRNDTKVKAPFYYESGKFRNWGAGR